MKQLINTRVKLHIVWTYHGAIISNRSVPVAVLRERYGARK